MANPAKKTRSKWKRSKKREGVAASELCSDIGGTWHRRREYSADWSGVGAISYNYRQRWTGIVPRRNGDADVGTMGRETEAGHATVSTIIFHRQNNALPIANALIVDSTRNRPLSSGRSTVKSLKIEDSGSVVGGSLANRR